MEAYRYLSDAGIRLVTPRHEQAAGYAADAYARVTGIPGVVLTTSGPGVLNAATAAAVAYADSVPMLLISPGPPRGYRPGAGLLHEVRDQSAALANICAASHRVRNVGDITEVVGRFFAEHPARRPRPVHLEIPVDLWDLPVDDEPAGGHEAAGTCPREPPAASVSSVRAAADVLSHATTPVVVAGGGARRAGGVLAVLAERIGAPILTTAAGKGTVAEDHPLVLGAGLHLLAARQLLAAADTVLAIGTELAQSDMWQPLPPLRGALIRIDVDPAQLSAPPRPAHALAGDAAAILARLLPEVSPAPSTHRLSGRRRAFRAQSRWLAGRWLPWVRALRSALPADSILVNDVSTVCYHGALVEFAVPRPDSFLYPAGFAPLGYALPAAIGARLGAPRRPVAVLTGDGAAQFTINELATACELGGPLPIVVALNGGYGAIREEMQRRGMTPAGVQVPGPDLVRLAEAYGARGTVADRPAALADAVRQSLLAPVPTVITFTAGGSDG